MRAQSRKLKFIRSLQEEHKCPVLAAGDIFDKWKRPPTPFLIAWALKRIPASMYVVQGQHDLPSNSILRYEKSALHVLDAAGRVNVLQSHVETLTEQPREPMNVSGYAYGVKMHDGMRRRGRRSIAVCHTLTWAHTRPFPGCTSSSARSMLKKFPGYDLILTGDNHQSFVVEYKGRLLVNPGSMMRMSADQKDHVPKVYLWYADNNTAEPVTLPHKKGVVSRVHIEREESRNDRMVSFVRKLGKKVDIGLSFTDNMKRYMHKNKTKKRIRRRLWEILEG